MERTTRIIVKNLVIALTFGLAGFATWAVTQSDAPAIEAAAGQVQRG